MRDSPFLQPELVLFALLNLGSKGDESRLVDCPVHDPAQANAPTDYDYTDYSTSATCDPYLNTYATLACGTSDAASKHP